MSANTSLPDSNSSSSTRLSCRDYFCPIRTLILYDNKKDDYRQRNVRQFVQSAEGTIWLVRESHAGMSLPSPVLRVEAFGYLKRV